MGAEDLSTIIDFNQSRSVRDPAEDHHQVIDYEKKQKYVFPPYHGQAIPAFRLAFCLFLCKLWPGYIPVRSSIALGLYPLLGKKKQLRIIRL